MMKYKDSKWEKSRGERNHKLATRPRDIIVTLIYGIMLPWWTNNDTLLYLKIETMNSVKKMTEKGEKII